MKRQYCLFLACMVFIRHCYIYSTNNLSYTHWTLEDYVSLPEIILQKDAVPFFNAGDMTLGISHPKQVQKTSFSQLSLLWSESKRKAHLLRSWVLLFCLIIIIPRDWSSHKAYFWYQKMAGYSINIFRAKWKILNGPNPINVNIIWRHFPRSKYNMEPWRLGYQKDLWTWEHKIQMTNNYIFGSHVIWVYGHSLSSSVWMSGLHEVVFLGASANFFKAHSLGKWGLSGYFF